jgi:hypothetical protein
MAPGNPNQPPFLGDGRDGNVRKHTYSSAAAIFRGSRCLASAWTRASRIRS